MTHTSSEVLMSTASSIDLCFLPATELATRIRRRDISPVEAVESYLRRIEERNPAVNAYTLVLAEQATDAARAAEAAVMSGRPLGPLHGVPVAIKDLDDVAGVPTSMGSLAVENRVPKTSAAAVERLLEAGAIVLGKTNTPEFGHKGITDNLRFGPTSTPWKIGYNSGGSSGGSAAAVAGGMAALGQGTDGGGSVRIPASFSGVVGFKPSFGRVPSVTRPDAFLWGHPLVHIGPLARTVGDAALMTSVMAGPHAGDPLALPDDGVDYLRGAEGARRRFRVAFSPQLGDFPIDRRVAGVVRSAVEVLARSGVQVDEVKLDFGADHDTLARLWVRVISVHYGAIARHWKQEGVDLLGEHSEKLTPQFRQMLIDAETILAVDHALDDVLRTGVFVGLQSVFERYDLIVSPTLAIPPVRNASDGNTIGPTDIGGDTVDPLIGWCMTFPINFTGHPAISVPAGLTPEGLPVGLQIIGRSHADETVLALASRFELAQPWFQDYSGLDKGAA
jgi:Asp-tRNA(Asn)/Glu-tRNA(Gln) amidotransferase A subunit family amidase